MLEDAWLQPGDLPDLVAALARPEWMRDALCREYPEVSFFPEAGESNEPAKAICQACLARAECLTYAVDAREEHGIWGGESPRVRRALRQAPEAA